MPKGSCCSPPQVRQMKQIATKATNEAAKVQADESLTRSTRTRKSYKIRSEALDKLQAILKGE